MKIAYFDYWNKGFTHFLPLDRELQKAGHKTLLLHVGSLRGSYPREESHQELLIRDISYYKTKYIYQMLEAEGAEVIVSLSTRYILDRALVLAARALNIETVYLMHGAQGWLDTTDPQYEQARKAYNRKALRLSRVRKYAQDVIPNYFYSYFRARHAQGWLRPFRVALKYFFDPGGCMIYPPFPDEIVHDKCLVHAQSDVENFVKIGYSKSAITVTGNPKLDLLQRRIVEADFSAQRLPLAVAKWVETGQKFAVLVEDVLPEQWSSQDRNDYINVVSAALKENGYRLAVKIHSGTRGDSLRIADPEVPVYQIEALEDLIYHCQMCITYSASAVNQAVLLSKPILQPRWGKAGKVSETFIRQGVSRAWVEPHRLPPLTVSGDALEGFKRQHISVLAPTALSNVVQQIVASRRG